MFTLDTLGSLTMSTVVSGDAGPVTAPAAPGSGDIIVSDPAPILTEERSAGVKV